MNIPSTLTSAKFIVFEGIDGAGKTTQLKLLAEELDRLGIPAVLTAEPTGGAEGKQLRRALSGEVPATPAELAELFTKDRIAHNTDPENGISAQLSRGTTVLCDRYYYSTLAYQGPLTDYDRVADRNLNCPEIKRPDLCIFLDLTPEESMARILKNRTSTEIYETREQLERIRGSFMETFSYLREFRNPDGSARGERMEILSAAGTPEEVAARILAAVLPLYENS